VNPSAIPRRASLAKFLLLGCVALVFFNLYVSSFQKFFPTDFELPAPPPVSNKPEAPRYDVRQITHETTPFAHSAAVVEIAQGSLRAFWFGGAREGATDAAIYSAVYAQGASAWSDESIVLTPRQLQGDLQRWVRKVGNPVVARDRQGRLHLFVVSVTAGGWAASSINTVVSEDDGTSWGRAKRLVTSPFLNFSTLVKGAPVLYGDGHFGVPVYHELAAKFGELLRVTPSGEVLYKTRLSPGSFSLQPVIVPRNNSEAIGLMRYSGPPPGRVLIVRTQDGGRSWSAPEKTSLPNPNSALDAIPLADGSTLMAFNNSEDSRNDLSLAHSQDAGRTWRVIRQLESSTDPNAQFSYPRLLKTKADEYHLLYTVDKKLLRHARFNQAWLDQALK
jgi:predicted neuraminidase